MHYTNHIDTDVYKQSSEILGFKPLPDDKILDWSKLTLIADDILKCI